MSGTGSTPSASLSGRPRAAQVRACVSTSRTRRPVCEAHACQARAERAQWGRVALNQRPLRARPIPPHTAHRPRPISTQQPRSTSLASAKARRPLVPRGTRIIAPAALRDRPRVHAAGARGGPAARLRSLSRSSTAPTSAPATGGCSAPQFIGLDNYTARPAPTRPCGTRCW